MSKVTNKDYTEEYYDFHLRMYEECDTFHSRIKRVLYYLRPRRSDVIVDLGCGIGTIAIEAAKKCSYVYAIDYSAIALRKTKILLAKAGVSDRAKVICSSAGEIPIIDNSIDKVICADLIEHLYQTEFENMARECCRILRKGGSLIIHTSPNPSDFKAKIPVPVKLPFRIIRYFWSQLRETDEEIKRKEYWRALSRNHFEKYGFVHVDLKNISIIKKTLVLSKFQVSEMLVAATGFPYLERLPYVRFHIGGDLLVRAVKS
jgi:ubiquinone/menaquinone biosynthesis C-methylase UbiE